MATVKKKKNESSLGLAPHGKQPKSGKKSSREELVRLRVGAGEKASKYVPTPRVFPNLRAGPLQALEDEMIAKMTVGERMEYELAGKPGAPIRDRLKSFAGTQVGKRFLESKYGGSTAREERLGALPGVGGRKAPRLPAKARPLGLEKKAEAAQKRLIGAERKRLGKKKK